MAATSQRKHTRRSRNHQGHKSKSSTNGILLFGVGTVVLVLLTFGMMQVMGLGSGHEAGSESAAVSEISRYLGPASYPASLTLAEQGQLDTPTLVWFHADWCHVCQQIKPEVVELGKEYEGQIKFVRLNVDHGESRAAVSRYRVRATPTFVLIDGQGRIRGNVPGWPGYQNITGAFEQLLAGG